jgi:hypothetical protein
MKNGNIFNVPASSKNTIQGLFIFSQRVFPKFEKFTIKEMYAFKEFSRLVCLYTYIYNIYNMRKDQKMKYPN